MRFSFLFLIGLLTITAVGASQFSLHDKDLDRYDVQFTNQEGLLVSFQVNEGFNRGYWYDETVPKTNDAFKNAFVLSDCSFGDEACFSHVLKYSGYEFSQDPKVYFDDVSTGSREVILRGSINDPFMTGNVVVGGVSYNFKVDTQNGHLTIDQNGDGDFDDDVLFVGLLDEKLLKFSSAASLTVVEFIDPDTDERVVFNLQSPIVVNDVAMSPTAHGESGLTQYGTKITRMAINVYVDYSSSQSPSELCRLVPSQYSIKCNQEMEQLAGVITSAFPATMQDFGLTNAHGRAFADDVFVRVEELSEHYVVLTVNGHQVRLSRSDTEELYGVRITLHSWDESSGAAFVDVEKVPSERNKRSKRDYSQKTVYLDDMSSFPDMFKSGLNFVVGASAPSSDVVAVTDIAQSLRSTNTGNTRLDSEMPDFDDMIVVGRPCNNLWVERLTGISSCDLNLRPGQGFIGLYNAFGHYQIIVSGYGDDEVRLAARALANWPKVSGDSFIVEGTMTDPVVRSSELPEEENVEQLERREGPVDLIFPEQQRDVEVAPPSFPDQDVVELKLFKGWNLVSLPGSLIKFLDNECVKKPSAFVYLDDENEYVSLKDASSFVDIERHLADTAFWIYSYDDCVQKVRVDGSYAPVLRLKDGWNLLPSYASVRMNCPGCDFYWWDAEWQQWSGDEITGANMGMLVRK